MSGSNMACRAVYGRETELAPSEAPEGLKLATFAGGCFWGLELAFQRQPGVVKTTVGYTGGNVSNPTYEYVCMGSTGHAEAVQVTYDPKEVTYRELLDLFFDRIDPTTLNRQGNDQGTQYRSAIYYHDEAQKEEAQKKINEINAKLKGNDDGGFLGRLLGGKEVVTELTYACNYYIAEAYHQ